MYPAGELAVLRQLLFRNAALLEGIQNYNGLQIIILYYQRLTYN